MRSIKKGHPPQELISWKAENAKTPENLKYGKAGFPMDAVRNSLLKEQYHLCAYTMRSLKTKDECAVEDLDTTSSCHVEHILPQSRNVSGEDIDYQNMVACYPPSQTKTNCLYGAHAKADFDPSNGNFVSPLDPNAESHFDFNIHGYIIGKTLLGKNTICILKLDHQVLINDRKAAIRGYLKPGGKEISAKKARRIAQQIMKPDNNHKLPAYCVAIAQMAIKHADRQESRSARMKKS